MSVLKTLTRRGVLAGLAAAGLLVGPLHAADWRPDGSVTIVVPSTAGGISDLVARTFAEHLGAAWDVNVVVENKPGSGGILGTTQALNAEADGTTLFTTSPGPQATAFTLYDGLPYAPEDIQPISGVVALTNVLVVGESVPVETLDEFVTYMREHPGELNYGSPIGASPHLSALWFTQLLDVEATMIPYQGSSQMKLALLNGETQFAFDNMHSQLDNIREGKVKGFGVTTAEANPAAPELAPLSQQMPELADFTVNTWIGLSTRAGAPEGAAEAYNQEVKAMLDNPEYRDRLTKVGALPDYMPLEDYEARIANEVENWREVISTAGVKLELN